MTNSTIPSIFIHKLVEKILIFRLEAKIWSWQVCKYERKLVWKFRNNFIGFLHFFPHMPWTKVVSRRYNPSCVGLFNPVSDRLTFLFRSLSLFLEIMPSAAAKNSITQDDPTFMILNNHITFSVALTLLPMKNKNSPFPHGLDPF